ncbi:TetR/AcrR family transcriptional regulator [Fusibacter ferrireducens]|uniref:TetR/AcrR family transcriptional regulator n=1 Tax=Fusibacter ferrireducens TaxID=2785058 RepID=A0ABR9ZMV3_9FIRM|nr:TetR/AcrR family transcriptional regulator [Fusibacter ferrireducens]MBF4691793.1 TetR/AcrR family transcriptional regulator [Fusibacter ferrireducens]
MNQFNVGRRESKKAETKIEIMKAFIERLEMDELNAIRVQDICDVVGISKVTFFNYFTSKEQVIEYFIHFWQYDLDYQICQTQLRGRALIYELFRRVGAHPASKHILNAIMLFFIKTSDYKPMTIDDYELYLWNSDAYNQGFRLTTIQDLFEKGLAEWQVSSAEIKTMMNNLLSGFYGMAFLQTVSYADNLNENYEKFLDSILPLDLK